jgi:hypothetical protein
LSIKTETKAVFVVTPNPEKNTTTLSDIKTYKETFVEPEALSQVEVMQERRTLDKIETEVNALMAKADALIEEKSLVLPKVARDKTSQAALEDFEQKMESLNTQLEELNHAI